MTRRGVFAVSAALALGALVSLTACNQSSWPEHDPTVIENAGADSVTTWPPRLRYALPGDNVIVKLKGLRRLYACARVLGIEWRGVDSAGAVWLAPSARFELPALPDCALSNGLDTTLDTTAPAVGKKLYLRTPAGTVTDSVLSIAGTGVVEGFLHPPGDTLRVYNRFTFRDSTAGHPRRALYADSLETCEFVQGATWRRLHGGDTLSIYVRTILAAALDTTVLRACAGPHSDTVTAAENLYGYP
jgi:hypothetical protein